MTDILEQADRWRAAAVALRAEKSTRRGRRYANALELAAEQADKAAEQWEQAMRVCPVFRLITGGQTS